MANSNLNRRLVVESAALCGAAFQWSRRVWSWTLPKGYSAVSSLPPVPSLPLMTAPLPRPQVENIATPIEIAQSTADVQGPMYFVPSGVSFRRGDVAKKITFTPNSPYSLGTGSWQVSCHAPYLSTVLMKIM